MSPLDAAELRAVLEESALSPALTAQVLETLAAAERERDVSRSNLALALEGHANDLDDARLEYSELHALSAQNFARATEEHTARVECQKDFDTLKAHHEAERAAHEATRAAFEGRIEALLNESKTGWAMAERQRVKAARLRTAIRALAETDEPPALLAPQPPPTRDARSVEVWPSLLAKYGAAMSPELRALCEARDAQGRAKYGTALTTFNGRDAATDALQEALDGAAYSHQSEMQEEHSEDVNEFWAACSRVDLFLRAAESARLSAKGGGR